MDPSIFDVPDVDNAWCPGCGNFGIQRAVKQSLADLGLKPQETVFVSGIGQAAKSPQYINTNYFNGLHGRSLPVAFAIKASNPDLNVIVESGDGCSYGEGGNHFVHTILRNPDITVIVNNNMIYGLTKGQASPTSECGFITPVQVGGVINDPFNPLAVAIALDAPFVARAYIGDREKTTEIIKQAISHRGFCLVDIFQPCVSFNKLNTYQWFRENTYYLEDDYDPSNRTEAFNRATEKGRFPLGVFYMKEKPTFHEHLEVYRTNKDPLFKRGVDKNKLQRLIESKRT